MEYIGENGHMLQTAFYILLEIMLKCCTRTYNLWNRKDDSRGSSVIAESLAPIFSRKILPDHRRILVLRFPPPTEQKRGRVWWRHTSLFYPYGRCFGSRTSVWGCWCEMGCCESVHHRGVPRKTPTALPGNEDKAIGTFPVVSKQASWWLILLLLLCKFRVVHIHNTSSL